MPTRNGPAGGPRRAYPWESRTLTGRQDTVRTFSGRHPGLGNWPPAATGCWKSLGDNGLSPMTLILEREHSLPILLHVHKRPASRRSFIEASVESSEAGFSVVSVLAVS